MDERARPPGHHTLEVSIFGPGRGECIVVHVPGGYWFAVDSLRVRSERADAEDGKESVAVHYLRLLGAELRAFFITHWHEDHAAGAAEVLHAFASSLELVGLPGGYGQRELASFVADLLPDATRFKLVRDLAAVISALDLPSLSRMRRVLLNDGTSLAPPNAAWRLDVLAPSFDDVRAEAATLAQFLPGYVGPQPKSFDVNSGCAVLRLEVGGRAVMLSSDLDVGSDDRRGWRCIVQNHGTRLDSVLVKVAHHGSTTAHHPPAWDLLRATHPTHAVVTPYPARGGPLPRESQLRRIRALTTTLHVTSPARGKAPTKVGKVKLADTGFLDFVPTKAAHASALGQIRYRLEPGASDFTIDVFPPAAEVP